MSGEEERGWMEKKKEKWKAEEEVFKFDRGMAILPWRVLAYMLASLKVQAITRDGVEALGNVRFSIRKR
jgi:hypothetical protein